MHNTSKSRFELVTAGHHFLLEALPFRRPESLTSLATFVARARRLGLPSADLEAVLLRCLTVLSHHMSTVPTLVERYLSARSDAADHLDWFEHCVRESMRFVGIEDGAVQAAIEIIEDNYADAACAPSFVAERLGIQLRALDVKFKRHAACTLTEYIRRTRMNAAAALLTTTAKTIKEIWVQVGYNHHSNFDHDFKRQFGVTPQAHRRSSIRPVAQKLASERPPPARMNLPSPSPTIGATVLIVDDDESTRFILSTWLRSQGHSVSTAVNGLAGLNSVRDMSPDAILVDYHLDDMDGVQLLRSIREIPSDAAVALFTADWDVSDRWPEVAQLNALVASKLCDPVQVNDLVLYLRASRDGLPESATSQKRLPLI